MQINITPDDIDKMVKDAIMKSALGKAIDDAIRSTLNDGSAWNNPFKLAIQERAKAVATDMLLEEPLRSQIAAAVAEHINGLVSGGALSEAVKALTQRMINNNN